MAPIGRRSVWKFPRARGNVRNFPCTRAGIERLAQAERNSRRLGLDDSDSDLDSLLSTPLCSLYLTIWTTLTHVNQIIITESALTS